MSDALPSAATLLKSQLTISAPLYSPVMHGGFVPLLSYPPLSYALYGLCSLAPLPIPLFLLLLCGGASIGWLSLFLRTKKSWAVVSSLLSNFAIFLTVLSGCDGLFTLAPLLLFLPLFALSLLRGCRGSTLLLTLVFLSQPIAFFAVLPAIFALSILRRRPALAISAVCSLLLCTAWLLPATLYESYRPSLSLERDLPLPPELVLAAEDTESRLALFDSPKSYLFQSALLVPVLSGERSLGRDEAMLTRSLHYGHFEYLFDRSIDMGVDLAAIPKESVPTREARRRMYLAALRTDFDLVSEGSYYIFRLRAVPDRSVYSGGAIGEGAEYISYIYPTFTHLGQKPLDSYKIEELLPYKGLYLSGFSYLNASAASKMVKALSVAGVKLTIVTEDSFFFNEEFNDNVRVATAPPPELDGFHPGDLPVRTK